MDNVAAQGCGTWMQPGRLSPWSEPRSSWEGSTARQFRAGCWHSWWAGRVQILPVGLTSCVSLGHVTTKPKLPSLQSGARNPFPAAQMGKWEGSVTTHTWQWAGSVRSGHDSDPL